jgi:hypothetical protein
MHHGVRTYWGTGGNLCIRDYYFYIIFIIPILKELMIYIVSLLLLLLLLLLLYAVMAWRSVKGSTGTTLPLTLLLLLTPRILYLGIKWRWMVSFTFRPLHFSVWHYMRGLWTFLFRTALGPTQPPIQWVRRALSLGVKRPRREADH